MTGITESVAEQAALDWLRDLGWQTAGAAGVRRALQPRASAPGARTVGSGRPAATVTAPERGPSRGSADPGRATSRVRASRRVTFGRTTFSGSTPARPMLMLGTGAVSLGSGYSSGPRPFASPMSHLLAARRAPVPYPGDHRAKSPSQSAQHLPDGCAHPEGHCWGFVVSEQ